MMHGRERGSAGYQRRKTMDLCRIFIRNWSYKFITVMVTIVCSTSSLMRMCSKSESESEDEESSSMNSSLTLNDELI
jgi:hypothetical protein